MREVLLIGLSLLILFIGIKGIWLLFVGRRTLSEIKTVQEEEALSESDECFSETSPEEQSFSSYAEKKRAIIQKKKESERLRQVLFLENEPRYHKCIRKFFSSAFEITIVTTLQKALAELEKSRPDAFVSDLFMAKEEQYATEVEKLLAQASGKFSRFGEPDEEDIALDLEGSEWPMGLVAIDNAKKLNIPCLIITNADHHGSAFTIEKLKGGYGYAAVSAARTILQDEQLVINTGMFHPDMGIGGKDLEESWERTLEILWEII